MHIGDVEITHTVEVVLAILVAAATLALFGRNWLRNFVEDVVDDELDKPEGPLKKVHKMEIHLFNGLSETVERTAADVKALKKAQEDALVARTRIEQKLDDLIQFHKKRR